jgi:predicted ribonuclease YlaK/intein/homing endonuclease
MKQYILDTSALIYDPCVYKQFPNSEVIIPITVLNELDKLKNGSNEASKNARVAIRLLDEISESGNISTGILLENNIMLKVDANYIDLEANSAFNGFGDPECGDTQILACTYAHWLNNRNTILVSNDINLRIKAKARGIGAQSHEGTHFSLSDLYTGTQVIVDEEVGLTLQQHGSLDPRCYGLKLNPHECVLFMDTHGNDIAMGRKVALDKLKLIKKSYPWNISARNKEQSFAIDLIMDPKVDLVTLIGRAGTGKSLIVLATALELVLNKREYDKFIIYRPIQSVGNDIGYLPGPQPLDVKIATPNGWTTMGDIKPDDLIIGSDGKSKRVLKIFPKGKKEVFKVLFSDGSSTECCEDHLWYTTTLKESQKNGKGSVKSLKEIRETLKVYETKINNHKIDLVKPVEFIKQDLIIDPYIIGILLGDSTLLEEYLAYFTSSDKENCFELTPEEILCKIGNKVKDSYNYNFIVKENLDNTCIKYNIFFKEIKKIALLNSKSETKFIPEKYKINSIENRLALLQGLMDSGGFVSTDGSDVSYLTTSNQLALDIQFIVQSLGGIAHINDKLTKYNYNEEKEIPSKVVSISLPKDMCPFKLERKVSRFKSRKCPLHRMIVDIIPVGIKETKCILVESEDHLYATDNFILTHNTMEEKLAPWFQAIMDNFEMLFTSKDGGDWKRELEMYQKKGRIEMEAITYIRGRSIPNSIILVDECFPANQYIVTENGKEKIGTLYKKLKDGKELPLVKSYNGTSGKFEYKKLVHAWNRGKKKLIEIKCANRKIKCTENHRFLTENGWKEASKLQVGELIKTSEPTNHQLLRYLNSDQEQIILGSFLGDGNIINYGRSRFRLRIAHDFDQREYCDWKANMFGAKTRLVKDKGYAKKPAIVFNSEMFGMNQTLPKTKENCPQWVLDKLDNRGLSVWFMDNGSVNPNYNKARISTCSFDEDSQQRMVKKLQSWGIECSYAEYKGYFYIDITKSGYVKLAQMIAPYMHESMQYKCEKSKQVAYVWNTQYDVSGCTVVDAITYLDLEEEVYDIEVEDNHNFIVCSSSQGKNKNNSGLIAHNCQNLTKEDVKTILTRAGENTKIILTGDIEQIDNSTLDATSNGLTHVIEKFKDSDLAGHITFVQGERSKLASQAAEIL